MRIYERPDSPYWYAESQGSEKLHRFSTGVPRGRKTKQKAIQAAKDRLTELEAIHQAENSLTLKEAWVRYAVENDEIKESTRKKYEGHIAAVIHTVGDIPLCSINRQMVRTFITQHREVEKTTDNTIRNHLTVLRTLLSYAIVREWPGVGEVNPIQTEYLRGLKKSQPRPRWVEVEYLRRLLQLAEPKFWRPFLIVALGTGMRKTEILSLTWSDVDFDNGVIRLSWEKEKTGRGRIIPLSNTVRHTLLNLERRLNSPFVFPAPRSGGQRGIKHKIWKRLREKAGLPNMRIHDLRHSFASHVRQLGMSGDDRRAIVGHTDDRVHATYASTSVKAITYSLQQTGLDELLFGDQGITLDGGDPNTQ